MTEHLNDRELAARLLGESTPDVAAHLLECGECRHEVAVLSAELAGLAGHARAQAERDEFFWTRQRAFVRARLNEQNAAVDRPRLMWATASAAAIVLAAVLMLGRVSPSVAPHVNISVAHEADDEALLTEIQSDVQRGAPAALQPVQTLVNERELIAADRKGN